MAVFSFTDGRVELNANVLSTYVTSASLEISGDELESTAMGATYRSRIGGLKDWSVSLEFNQDVAASALDSIIFPLLNTVVTIKLRATSSAIGTSNPEYSGSVLVSQWNPFGNAVGELAKVSVQWPGAGTLSRATS